MKDLAELRIPDDRRYSTDHEWAKEEGGNFRVGISDFAQDQLGDVVFVELPEVGSSFQRGDVFGTVESVKAVSELLMPISGAIVEVNSGLEDTPEAVNDSPYEAGWMVVVAPSSAGAADDLLDAAGYREALQEAG